jgi:hypothetical protein
MSESPYSEYTLRELEEIVAEYCICRNGHKIPRDWNDQAKRLRDMYEAWRCSPAADPYLMVGLRALIDESEHEIQLEMYRRA